MYGDIKTSMIFLIIPVTFCELFLIGEIGKTVILIAITTRILIV